MADEKTTPLGITIPSLDTNAKLDRALTVADVLTYMINTKEAAVLAKIPGVKFRTEDGYKSAIGANGQLIPGVITDRSIQDVSIAIDGNDKDTSYFHRVHVMGADNALPGAKQESGGAQGVAWREVDSDGKQKNGELLAYFSGLTDRPNPTRGATAQNDNMFDIAAHEVAPQMLSVPGFMDTMIEKAGGRENISVINIGAHSLGSGNAAALHLLLGMQNIPVNSVLIYEPAAATVGIEKLREALDPKPEDMAKDPELAKLHDALLARAPKNAQGEAPAPAELIKRFEDDIKNDTVSVRVFRKNADGTVSLSNTAHLHVAPRGASDAVIKQIKDQNFSIGAFGDGKGNHPENVDVANGMAGTAVYMDTTGKKLILSGFTVIDAPHKMPNGAGVLQSTKDFPFTPDSELFHAKPEGHGLPPAPAKAGSPGKDGTGR